MEKNRVLGAIEVYGLPPFVEAMDAALKAADVTPVMIDSAGISMIALYVQGELGAVRRAVDAGVAAAERSTKAAGIVIANPGASFSYAVPRIREVKEPREPLASSKLALGVLQVEGLVPLVDASNAMLRAGTVEVMAYKWVGLRCHTFCFAGEIGDARDALNAGVAVAQRAGGEVFSCLLANPTPLIPHILGLSMPSSKEAIKRKMIGPLLALGVLEAKGATALLTGNDVLVKAARIKPIKTVFVGGAWLASFIAGELGAVIEGIEAGRAAASAVGEVISCVISNPLPEHLELFGIDPEKMKV